MSAPLEDIVILDLTRGVAGPFATMRLGDLGADVIKVEHPEGGDITRGWGPPFVEGESTYYLSVNRNKRSLTVNLKHPDGLKIIEKLIPRADVLIENFMAGAMDRWGLGYDVAHDWNMGLIYCSISAYGRKGGRADRPSFDLAMQAEAGIMDATGSSVGPPTKAGLPLVDVVTGMTAVEAILAALIQRGKTSLGMYLDIAMMDSALAVMTYQAQNALSTGKPPKRMGNIHPSLSPYQLFETKDGSIVLAVATESQWKDLCEVIGLHDLISDARFVTNKDRVEHRTDLEVILSRKFREWPAKKWIEALTRASIPCGVIQNVQEALAQVGQHHRNLLVETDHPRCGKLKMVGSPIFFSDGHGAVNHPPPLIGQHTDAILAGLGYTPDQIQDLRQRKAI